MTGIIGYDLLEEYNWWGYSFKILDPNKLPELEGYPIPENNNKPPLITPINEQDKDAGKLVTPVVEKDKNEGIYTGPEIDIGDWRDNVLTSQKPYEPNQGSVGNMGEFLGQPGFGSDVKKNSNKTSRQYQGQSIYTAKDDINTYIEKGDQFYLDGQHKNHLEVFDKRNNFKYVLNLDGSLNKDKTMKAQGRKLPKWM